MFEIRHHQARTMSYTLQLAVYGIHIVLHKSANFYVYDSNPIQTTPQSTSIPHHPPLTTLVFLPVVMTTGQSRSLQPSQPVSPSLSDDLRLFPSYFVPSGQCENGVKTTARPCSCSRMVEGDSHPTHVEKRHRMSNNTVHIKLNIRSKYLKQLHRFKKIGMFRLQIYILKKNFFSRH